MPGYHNQLGPKFLIEKCAKLQTYSPFLLEMFENMCDKRHILKYRCRVIILQISKCYFFHTTRDECKHGVFNCYS